MTAPAEIEGGVAGEVLPSITPALLKRMEMKPTLGSCESAIQRAFDAYAMAGEALRTVRDKKLYREAGFTTFEDYCRERWHWQRSQAYRLIDAAKVWETLYDRLSPIGDKLEPPRTEAAARELAPLKSKPKLLVQAWQETVERHGPDAQAKHVRAAVQRIAPSKPKAQGPEPERTLNDTVTALHRLIASGHTPKLIRQAIDAIDPQGARHA